MSDIFGLPQALTGAELVTIQQMQDGRLAKCTMPLSTFSTWIFAGLPTTEPTTAGVPWNNAGVISLS